jgi:predicted YcjX-like family ATPase
MADSRYGEGKIGRSPYLESAMSPQPNRVLLAAMDADHERSEDERVEEEDNCDLT